MLRADTAPFSEFPLLKWRTDVVEQTLRFLQGHPSDRGGEGHESDCNAEAGGGDGGNSGCRLVEGDYVCSMLHRLGETKEWNRPIVVLHCRLVKGEMMGVKRIGDEVEKVCEEVVEVCEEVEKVCEEVVEVCEEVEKVCEEVVEVKKVCEEVEKVRDDVN